MLIDPAVPGPVPRAIRVDLGLDRASTLGHLHAAWIGGDRWVIVCGSFGDEEPTRAWVADAGTGKVSAIDGFTCPKPASGRAATGGGPHGFAVIGDWSTGSVTRFDSAGAMLWSISPGMSIQDAAIRTDGTLGVLVGVQNLILEYDASGAPGQRTDLAAAFGGRPNYVAGLDPDQDGGWVVTDFNGRPPVRRLGKDRARRGEVSPRYADGRTFRLYGDVRRAPDGRLWTSDHAALLRLDESGVVDLVVGPAPADDDLHEVRAVTVDHRGRIYALDGRSGSTHIFDSAGRRLKVLRPEPTDFVSDPGIGSIAVAGDGSVYCRPTSIGMGERRYLKFDAQGARAGFQARRSGEVCDEWFFRPGGSELLVLGYERAFLFDAQGQPVCTISRRADEQWLERPDDAAVAPDGVFAILAFPSSRGGKAGPSVTLYSPAGVPLKTHELPGANILSRIAASNTTVAVVCGAEVVLLDRAGARREQLAIPHQPDPRSYLAPFFSPDGQELWLIDPQGRRMERYKMPAA